MTSTADRTTTAQDRSEQSATATDRPVAVGRPLTTADITTADITGADIVTGAPTARDAAAEAGTQQAAGAGLLSGAGWLSAATLTVGVLNYAYALALTHLLSPGSYAQFAAAQALLLTAGTVASASIPWVLAQQLARPDPVADAAALTRVALLGNAVQGVIAAGVILAAARSFAGSATALTVAGCVFLIFVSSTTPGWLQGRRQFRSLAAVKVVEVVVKCVVGIVLALLTQAATAPLGAFGAGAGVVLLLGLVRFRHQLPGPVTLGLLRSLWRDAVGVASVQGMVSVLACLDVVLVAVLPIAAPQAAGYQAAMILARVPLYLAGAVATAALPMVSGAAAHEAAGQFRSALQLYATVAVPFAVALATAPDQLVYLLFPADFSMIGVILAPTAAAGLMIGTIELVTTFYQGRGAYRPSLVYQVGAATVSVAAMLTGYRLDGLVGLAIGALTGALTGAGGLLVDSAGRWPGAVRLPLRGVLLTAALTAALSVAARQPLVWIICCLATAAWTVHRIARLRRGTGPDADGPTARSRS